MKKILLIVAIVVCVAVAGTALALTTYNDATPLGGTLTADTYLSLSLDDCSTTALALEVGEYSDAYTIDYDIAKSASVTPSATLTIALADAGAGHDLDDVTIALFTNSNFSTPLKLGTNATTGAIDQENGTAATLTGAGTITITGLNASGVIYARFYVDGNADADDVGGTMTLNLVSAAE